jgi:acid stress chaperone HdeB
MLCRNIAGLAQLPIDQCQIEPVPARAPSRAKGSAPMKTFAANSFAAKSFAAFLVGCWLLSGMTARAETIDFSTTTCKQFLDGHKNEISIILAWLDGYYREEDDPPIFDTDKFEANSKKLAGYCAANPTVGLITAADKLFGK